MGQPEPSFSVWYAFATVAAAADRSDEALQYFGEAANHGHHDAGGMRADNDLKSLHSNPKFQELVAKLRRLPQS